MRNHLIAILLVVAALIAPIWLNSYLPLVDYPNHLARMEILTEYERSPAYQDTYIRDYRLLPNLAMDLSIPLLHQFLSLHIAGKLFLTFLLLLYCAGTSIIGTLLHGRFPLRVVFVWPLFYNSAFLWGFINYVAGVAVFTLWAGLLLYTISENSSKWRTVCYFLLTIGAFVCYVAHLTSFAFCALTWGILVLRELILNRRIGKILLLCGLSLPLPIIHHLGLQASGGVASAEIAMVVYVWSRKLVHLTGFTRGYRLSWDVFPTLVLGLLVAYCCLRSWKRPFISNALWPAAALASAFILLPTEFNAKTGSGVDLRFLWPAVVLLILAFPTTAWRERERRTLALLASLAFTFRIVEIQTNWNSLSGEIQTMVSILRQLPEGARLYPLPVPSSGADDTKRAFAFANVPAYLVAEKKILYPPEFAAPGAQPIVFRKPIPYYSQVSPKEFAQFDYVWGFQPGGEIAAYLATHADVLGHVSGYSLWRLRN